MKNETDYTYEVESEVSMLNENGIMKPHGYQILFAQLAEQHLNNFHCNADDTMQYGIAWALISMTVEIEQPITTCEKLFAKTWHSSHKGPYWRRELVFRNAAGDILFKGSTFSVLLDIEKRTVYRKREVPFFTSAPTEIFMTEAHPTLKAKLDYTPVEERKAYNSYIDMLGHVNNCRYSEFAYDAFTDEEKARLADMRHIEIYFASELRCGDTFQIGKTYEDGKMYIRGHNNTKDNTSFDFVIY